MDTRGIHEIKRIAFEVLATLAYHEILFIIASSLSLTLLSYVLINMLKLVFPSLHLRRYFSFFGYNQSLSRRRRRDRDSPDRQSKKENRAHNANLKRDLQLITDAAKRMDRDIDAEIRELQKACDLLDPKAVYAKIDELHDLQIPLPVYVVLDCFEMIGRVCYFPQGVAFLNEMCIKKISICPHFFTALFNSHYVRSRSFVDVILLCQVMFSHAYEMTEHNLNTLLDICAEDETATVLDGLQLFNEYEQRQGPVQHDMAFNILMKSCARKADLFQAWQILSLVKYRCIPFSDILFTSLIDCIAESPDGTCATAWHLIDEMVQHRVFPNVRTINAYCKVCARRGVLANYEMIFEKMKTLDIGPDQLTFNTLIDTYANSKMGTIVGARELLSKMSDHHVQADVRTYTSLMKVCSRRRDYGETVRVYREMLSAGIKPNIVTFNTLIDALAYSRSSKVYAKAKQYLVSMASPNYAIMPNCTTYTCLIKVLMKRRQLKDACEVFQLMQERGVKPNAWTITTLGFQKRRSPSWEYYRGPPIESEGKIYYGPRHKRQRDSQVIEIINKIDALGQQITANRNAKIEEKAPESVAVIEEVQEEIAVHEIGKANSSDELDTIVKSETKENVAESETGDCRVTC